MSTTSKTINKTKRDALVFQKTQASIVETTGINQDDLNVMIFDYGCFFAEWFASLFLPGQEQKIKDFLLQTPARPGEPNNWFWMWWRIKWMRDDEAFIKNNVYTFMGYTQHKSYLLHSETLELELLNMFNNRKNKNNDAHA